MKLPKIFSKKSVAISYDSLPSSERKRIMEKAVKSANKEQFELVKAYRTSKCATHHS